MPRLRPTRKAFLGWWGCVSNGGATVGDALALQAAYDGLRQAGWEVYVGAEDYAAAHIPAAVDTEAAEPSDYSAFAWICGPLIGGSQPFRSLLERFRGLPQVAASVSVLPPSSPDRFSDFDKIFARDGLPQRTFDFALAAYDDTRSNARAEASMPTVGVSLRGRQREYGLDRSLDIEAAALVGKLVEQIGLPVRTLETRLDRTHLSLVGIEQSFAANSVIVTTRLHGALLALKHRVPFIALDQIKGGGKVGDVLGALGWPWVWRVENVSETELFKAARALHSAAARRKLSEVRTRAIDSAHAAVNTFVEAMNACTQAREP